MFIFSLEPREQAERQAARVPPWEKTNPHQWLMSCTYPVAANRQKWGLNQNQLNPPERSLSQKNCPSCRSPFAFPLVSHSSSPWPRPTLRLTFWLVKNGYPKWKHGKWKHGLKSVVPWWFDFDPYPSNRCECLWMPFKGPLC